MRVLSENSKTTATIRLGVPDRFFEDLEDSKAKKKDKIIKMKIIYIYNIAKLPDISFCR